MVFQEVALFPFWGGSTITSGSDRMSIPAHLESEKLLQLSIVSQWPGFRILNDWTSTEQY